MGKGIVVLGAGWIGRLLAEYFHCDLCGNFITSEQDVKNFHKNYRPAIVINAAGVSGETSIDWCESHKKETYFGNVHLPYLLNFYSHNYQYFKLVHLSTCYIDYDKSFYTLTKKMAEEILDDHYGEGKTLITRINLPVDKVSHPRNLIDKLLAYDEIFDEKVHLTVLDDFFVVLKELIEKDQSGIWNCINSGTITLKEIVNIYEKESGKSLSKIFIPSKRIFKDIISEVEMPDVKKSVTKQVKKYIKEK